MPIKVAIIGAGSIGFTRTIVRDLLCVPELRDTRFAFTDINPQNLDMVRQLCARDIAAAGFPATISATTDRREAFQDADYVLCFVRVGGLEAFTTDIEIPLKYGVDQCVGDTLGPGGIMYAQRTINVLLGICKDISEVAAPDCLFINYSNPMAMNTWACNKYGYGVKTIGLCHGVEGGHAQIARAFGLDYKEVDIICAGINHQTWYIGIKHQGEDLTGKLLAAFEQDPELCRTEKARLDVMRRFGYYTTESNGHLSEYLPWYRKRAEDLPNWIDLSCWINGETGGYLRVCTEGRNWFEHDFPNWMQEAPNTFNPEDRSREHASYIIESSETGRMYRGHFNVVNGGCIPNLSADAIVEVPGYVDGNGLSIPIVGELPLGPAAICQVSINVQRLGMEAAMHGDDLLLRQAMLMDSLTGAVCNPPEVWQMADEMLVAGEAWLPQYATAIAEAKTRLAAGNLIPTRGYESANRLHTKTIAEMELDRDAARKNAAEADKAKERTAAV
jgi:alpha-galactosidase